MGGAIQFSVDWQGYVPSVLFTWGQTMMEVMKIMMNFLKRSHAGTATIHAPNPAADHCLPTPHPETPRNSQASLSQSPVGFLFLSPRSWCAQDFVCSLQESASPVLCKFCNEIPLGSKVKFSGRSQSLFQIPRLGNLLWVLELS